jgi:hypothetical protein
MFKPGKSYLYGLSVLCADPDRLARFRRALADAHAPPWPDGPAGAALDDWVRRVGGAEEPSGRWWALLEEHAQDAVAVDPGLGFGLFQSAEELRNLPVVRCGAAKDLYADPAVPAILAGRSLDLFRHGEQDPRADPIRDVMVAAKMSIGQFGGALRRLLYSLMDPTAEQVQAAQCLTEQVTQKALSVKGGKPPIDYKVYEALLERLLDGADWPLGDPSADGSPDERELLGGLRKVWEQLRKGLGKAPAWLTWLRGPHELSRLVEAHGLLRLPLADLRLGEWLGRGRS